jgi:hypothetical protein
MKCIIGGAGTGKTRLAIELCEAAEANGWFATFLPSSEFQSSSAIQTLAGWILPQHALLVVDYAATSVAGIKRWLDALATRDTPPDHKLRILLVERHADCEYGWWADLLHSDSRTRACVADLIGAETPYVLPPLDTIGDRRALLAEVITKAAPLLDPPRAAMELPTFDANTWFDQRVADNSFDPEPLYLIMAGIHALEAGAPAALAMNKPDLAKRIANIESERLRKFAIARGFTDQGRLLQHMR